MQRTTPQTRDPGATGDLSALSHRQKQTEIPNSLSHHQEETVELSALSRRPKASPWTPNCHPAQTASVEPAQAQPLWFSPSRLDWLHPVQSHASPMPQAHLQAQSPKPVQYAPLPAIHRQMSRVQGIAPSPLPRRDATSLEATTTAQVAGEPRASVHRLGRLAPAARTQENMLPPCALRWLRCVKKWA